MENCIFCKIINGEIKSEKIYEDKDFFAFLDARPQSAGHTLVVPKAHYRWVWDIPNIDAYALVTQKVARAIQKAFGNDWVISKVIGDEIDHAHTHLFVQKSDANKADFEGNAKKIRDFL